MTRRDMRREATKATVIEAARKVFLERGYDGTTIKLIADDAGVSPGTVLNAAPSKAALLVQILQEEYEAIGDAIARLEGALSGRLSDRLTALLQVCLEAQTRHSGLFAAAIGHSWLWTDPVYEETFDQMDGAWESLNRVLEAGKASGTLRSDLDVVGTVMALQDLYLGVFRRIRWKNLDASGASQLLRQRVEMLLEGLAAN